MNSPAVDMAAYLDQLSGMDLTIATNLFVSEMPATPDICVAVYDTMEEPGDPRYQYERPRVQIRLRGGRGGYRNLYDLASGIKVALDGAADVQVSGTRYIGIWLAAGFAFLGYDGDQRPIGTLNFRLHRTPQAV